MGLSRRPFLVPARPPGKAAEFAGAGAEGETFFLALRQPVPDPAEDLRAGDILAVATGADAEPGDLVVWWRGRPGSEALARMGEDLRLHPLAGFPPPDARRGRPRIRGVVVGRLRHDEG